MQEHNLELFASCLAGLERPLADELKRLGVKRVRPLGGGVAFFCAPRRCCARACGRGWPRAVTLVVGAGGRARTRTRCTQGARRGAVGGSVRCCGLRALAVRAQRDERRAAQHDQFTALRGEGRRAATGWRAERGVRARLWTHRTPRLRSGGRAGARRGRATRVRWTWRDARSSIATTWRRTRGRTPRLPCGVAAGLCWRWPGWGGAPRLWDGGLVGPGLRGRRAVVVRGGLRCLTDLAPGLARRSAGGSSAGRGFDGDAWGALLDEADGRFERGSPRWRGRSVADAPASAAPDPRAGAHRGDWPPRRRPSPAARECVIARGPAPRARRASRPPATAGRASRGAWTGWLRSRPQAPSRRWWWRATLSRLERGDSGRRRAQWRTRRHRSPAARLAWPRQGSRLRGGGRSPTRVAATRFGGRALGGGANVGRGRIDRAGRRVRGGAEERLPTPCSGAGQRGGRHPSTCCTCWSPRSDQFAGPAAQERQGAPQVGASAKASSAIACTTPTCPTTTWPSTCTKARATREGVTFLHVAEYQAPSQVGGRGQGGRSAGSEDVLALAPVGAGRASRPRVLEGAPARDAGGGQYRDAGRPART